MSDRERVEAEARERYPAGDHSKLTAHMSDFDFVSQCAFLAGRTVAAEQVEAAAEALWNRSPFAEALAKNWDEWSRQNPNAAELWKDDVRFTLTAAGLLIKGEDHE